MTDLEQVSLRLFQELAALVQEVDPELLPRRGEKLSESLNALGEKAARHWLQTGRRPSHPEELAAWYPRLWFANTFLRHAVLFENRLPIPLGEPKQMPAVLMLQVWEKSGLEYWESQKQEFPWGG